MGLPLTEYWRLLSRYLAPQRPRFLMLLALVLLQVGLQVANPQIIALFIDDALGSAEESRLVSLAVVFVAAAILAQVVAVVATWVSETLGWTATNALRSDLAAHCLHLDMSFHKTRTPGEMIQRIDGDVDALSSFFSQFVLNLLGNLLLVAAILVALGLHDVWLGLAIGGFALVAMGMLVWLRNFAEPHWLALREEMAQFFGFVGEQLAGREDVRGNGARTYVLQRFHDRMHTWYPVAVRSGMSYAWMWIASNGLFSIGNIFAMLLSYYLWRSGGFSIGSVYLVFHYTEMIRRPIEQIREQVQQLQAASAGITRVRDILAIETKLADHGSASLADGALSLTLDRVSFGYDADEPVLREVSLRLEPGQVLGLLGRTGSGKTTLGRLLVRLYDAASGSVIVGGVPVGEVPLSELRRRVGVVSQDVQIFQGSVRDNLTFFDASISDSRVLAALRALKLEPWLESLPHGIDTTIGPGRLSTGEAQLLACGRAFLNDPGLVVLDEATSRLDPATQRLVDAAISQLLAGRTAVMIAHRLDTLDRADCIAVLEEGAVVESGARDDLLADAGSRFALLRRLDVEALLA